MDTVLVPKYFFFISIFRHLLTRQLRASRGQRSRLPLTLVELLLAVSAGADGQHHLPQQRQRAGHLLLTHPVLHQAEVGVVGCQQPQQSRMQAWVEQRFRLC